MAGHQIFFLSCSFLSSLKQQIKLNILVRIKLRIWIPNARVLHAVSSEPKHNANYDHQITQRSYCTVPETHSGKVSIIANL